MKISYEQAKELKDVGFPQGKSTFVYCHGSYIPREQIIIRTEKSDIVDAPTLEEVINECGVDVGIFVFADKTQGANAWYKHADPDKLPNFHGKTSLKAMIKLYISLNKK